MGTVTLLKAADPQCICNTLRVGTHAHTVAALWAQDPIGQEVTQIVLCLCLPNSNMGTGGKCHLAPRFCAFCSLEGFLLDAEGPFHYFPSLAFTFILSFQLADKCSSLLSIFTVCFAHKLNLLVRC